MEQGRAGTRQPEHDDRALDGLLEELGMLVDPGRDPQPIAEVAQDLLRYGHLAERAQVVTITHLPQIASVAERHFRVEKVPGDPTHTQIEQLGDLERRDEVERMLGGAEFLASLDR